MEGFATPTAVQKPQKYARKCIYFAVASFASQLVTTEEGMKSQTDKEDASHGSQAD